MQKPSFVNNKIYHIYNRGVEKRNIFGDDKDRFRFVHDLFEFNDTKPALNLNYYFGKQSMEVEPQYIRKPRKLLVEILAFCLMPNHYHLLLRQKLDKGIIAFMQKLGTGYTMYFNQKYERVGSLFQGRFKAILVNNDTHLLYLPHYIHLNPLDLAMPDWREKEIINHKKVMKFLESYRWSSFQDYIGIKNFPSVTQRNFVLELFGDQKNYKAAIKDYLGEFELETIRDLIIEVEPR